MKAAIARARSCRRKRVAFTQWLEGHRGSHNGKDASGSYGFDDVRLDLYVPAGAAALAPVMAAIRRMERKAPRAHRVSIGRNPMTIRRLDYRSETRQAERLAPTRENRGISPGRETCCVC